MIFIKISLKILLLSGLFVFAGNPERAKAAIIDSCPVQGKITERQNYLFDQLPPFDSPTHLFRSWNQFRNSACRFDQSALANFSGSRPLTELGDSDFNLSGARAAKALDELTAMDPGLASQWSQLAKEQAAQGNIGYETIFSMSEGSDLEGCDQKNSTCYDILITQSFRNGSKKSNLLTLDFAISMKCMDGSCELLKMEKSGPAVSPAEDSGFKGASSGAGGQGINSN